MADLESERVIWWLGWVAGRAPGVTEIESQRLATVAPPRVKRASEPSDVNTVMPPCSALALATVSENKSCADLIL